ncbi:MFS transporter [Microbulbifer sp. VAAF005]|uniref:MFS transporter n=1 Tax=Microbulbifer sp. VAAF005 TaxID=3034230 RepID=UPI0024AD6F6B|nr:MFS transporter [Microbulbifer sp. VAAF005]WHI47476.1 MFS transporter [Microbulbifer sp. VAAF005]
MSRSVHALILKFGLVQAGISAISGMIAPIIFLLFMSKGIELHEMGILLAVATISTVVLEVPFGALADRYGRKKTFIAGELILLFVVIGFWWSSSFAELIVFMILNGLSIALFSGTIDALFVEQFNVVSRDGETNLMEAQASVNIFQMIGLAVGAVFSGLIPVWFSFVSDSYDSIGFYEVGFVFLVPLILIHMLCTFYFVGESESMGEPVGSNFFREVHSTIKSAFDVIVENPVFKPLLLIDFISGVAFISLEQLWQPMLSTLVDSKESLWLFGILFALNYVCMAVGQGCSIPLSRVFKNNYSNMLLVLEFCTGLLFFIFAIQSDLYGFIVVYLLLHVVVGISMAPGSAMFHEKIPESRRSTILSVKSLIAQGGATAGALVAGYTAHYFSISIAWSIAGFVFIISSFLYLLPSISNLSKDMAIVLNKRFQPQPE